MYVSAEIFRKEKPFADCRSYCLFGNFSTLFDGSFGVVDTSCEVPAGNSGRTFFQEEQEKMQKKITIL